MILYRSIIEKYISLVSGHHSPICHQTLFPIQLCCRSILLFLMALFVNQIQFNEALLWYVLFVYLFKCKAIRSSIDLSSPGSISKAFLILYIHSIIHHTQLNMKSIKEIAITFSHFNFGTFALPYLTYLARPYDLEHLFTEFGHQGARFWMVMWKKVQGHKVAVSWLNRSSQKSHYYNGNFELRSLLTCIFKRERERGSLG